MQTTRLLSWSVKLWTREIRLNFAILLAKTGQRIILTLILLWDFLPHISLFLSLPLSLFRDQPPLFIPLTLNQGVKNGFGGFRPENHLGAEVAQ